MITIKVDKGSLGGYSSLTVEANGTTIDYGLVGIDDLKEILNDLHNQTKQYLHDIAGEEINKILASRE